jgi:hypothetical protein
MTLGMIRFGFIRTVAIFAYALLVTFTALPAFAQTAFEAGQPQTLDITAEVMNSISAVVTEPALTPWGVIRSPNAGENARLVMLPTGAQNGVADGDASAVQGGIGTPGAFVVTGAFPNTPVNVTFSNPVDLVCAACTVTNPVLELIEITAELTPPAVGGAGVDAVMDDLIPANNVVGNGFTDGAGNMTFYIGVVLQTTVGVEPYESGTYAGTFNALLEY